MIAAEISAARVARIQAVAAERSLAEQARIQAIRAARQAARDEQASRRRSSRLEVLDARIGDWRARADAHIARCPYCDAPTIHRHHHQEA